MQPSVQSSISSNLQTQCDIRKKCTNLVNAWQRIGRDEVQGAQQRAARWDPGAGPGGVPGAAPAVAARRHARAPRSH